MHIKIHFLVAGVCLCLFSRSSSAALVSYPVNIDSGYAITSGGITGGGIGTLPIEGSFILYLDDESSYAALENIDISLAPNGFDWNDLSGTITGESIYLVAASSDPSFPNDNTLQGTFNGESGALTGMIYEPLNDGLIYDCTMNISLIPEPSTVTLLGSGLIVIYLHCSRKHRNTKLRDGVRV